MLKIKSPKLAKYQAEVEAIWTAAKFGLDYDNSGTFADGTAYKARTMIMNGRFLLLTTGFGEYSFLVD